MKSLAVVLVVLAAAAATSGCVTTRAQTPTTRPPLEVPPVPPRVIEPAPEPPIPYPEPVGDLPVAPPATQPRAKPTARDNTTQKPETKTVEPPAPETPPATPPVAPNTPPVAPLRTAGTGDGAQAEKQVRDTIGRANGLLGRVDYRKLSPERRKAYDDAKRFLEASEGALKAANFEYAKNLADTAETLAKELLG
jgi:hypothetical protein